MGNEVVRKLGIPTVYPGLASRQTKITELAEGRLPLNYLRRFDESLKPEWHTGLSANGTLQVGVTSNLTLRATPELIS